MNKTLHSPCLQHLPLKMANKHGGLINGNGINRFLPVLLHMLTVALSQRHIYLYQMFFCCWKGLWVFDMHWLEWAGKSEILLTEAWRRCSSRLLSAEHRRPWAIVVPGSFCLLIRLFVCLRVYFQVLQKGGVREVGGASALQLWPETVRRYHRHS